MSVGKMFVKPKFVEPRESKGSRWGFKGAKMEPREPSGPSGS
jgi:hypothetical protein